MANRDPEPDPQKVIATPEHLDKNPTFMERELQNIAGIARGIIVAEIAKEAPVIKADLKDALQIEIKKEAPVIIDDLKKEAVKEIKKEVENKLKGV